MTSEKNYGKLIRTYRTKNKITQTDLSHAMGCTAQYVWKLENGKNNSVDAVKRCMEAITRLSIVPLKGELKKQVKEVLKMKDDNMVLIENYNGIDISLNKSSAKFQCIINGKFMQTKSFSSARKFVDKSNEAKKLLKS